MSISEDIARKISNELNLDKDKYEVINYGAFALIQIAISLLFVAIFGYIAGVFYEAIAISFTSSILRKSSGGAHASRPSTCVIFGTIVTVFSAILVKYLFGIASSFIIVLSGVVLFILSYYIILKKAPVDSKAKPINTTEKRSRMKRKSIKILVFYFFITATLTIIYFTTMNKNYLLYSMCIYFGFSWQVFTLTITGHNALNKIDGLFNYIFFKNKEVTMNEKE